jgi:histone H2A
MNRRRRMSLSVRAGITFPVRKFLRKLKKRTLFKVWIKAAVYTSAVVHYLISEILDLAGTITKRLKRKTHQPNHINNALRCDQELDKLTKNAILPEVTKMLLVMKPS